MREPETERATVLIIDDEVQIRRLLRVSLEKHGFRVAEAQTGQEGIDEAARCSPDAVLLDLGLPDMDGLTVLARLREWTTVPILIVSVRGEDDDKITALDQGADDYLTKPFSTGELMARLRAAQRRARPETPSKEFTAGRLSVELTRRIVKAGGQPVKLTAGEYHLLVLFVQNAGRVLTHGHILKRIWGSESADKMGQLRVYMSHLRDKIEANPDQPELLLTEPGIGYRLATPD